MATTSSSVSVPTSYKVRRDAIADLCAKHKRGDPLPVIDYTDEEISVWGGAVTRLSRMYESHACSGALAAFRSLSFSPDRVPTPAEVSAFLHERTGWTLVPAPGLVPARDFLAFLARREFPCTLFVRPREKSEFTDEPDVVHDMLGHCPMLAVPAFARLSEAIGAAAEGRSDEAVQRLAKVYFFSVEMGLIRENGEIKAYGAALLSSLGELRRAVCGPACGGEYEPFDPAAICALKEIQDNQYQPVLFVAESFESALEKLESFASGTGSSEDSPLETADCAPHSLKPGTFLRVINCIGPTQHSRGYVGFPIVGSAKEAELTIEAFLCLVCPFSRRAFATASALARKHAPRIALRVILHPQPWHPQAGILAVSAVATALAAPGDGSALSAFLAKVYERQDTIVDDATHGLSFDEVCERAAGMAAEAVPAVTPEAFAVHVRSGSAIAVLKRNVRYSRQNGVHASPTFLVNGLLSSRAQSSWSVSDWEEDLADVFSK